MVTNLLPDLLSAEKFSEIRSEILSAIDIADCQYHIRFFPRIFHRRMAVHLIALRVLRTMQVDTNCVQVTLANEVNEEEPAVPELEDDQSSVYHSQSGLHWPDIMTLGRESSSS
ncbi:hypothetical protein Y032_0058g2905 [Ancylostoma ceylanicum]|uniref:Uncharacterized protein n=1 Tax=Ancylostoma ceylanicum TaxID=53326 RepID=A0A016U3T1_9BILA|nr:hypothetical protein Y032_0058g2905 [Ancylostoma ceylanicum]